MNMKIGNMLQRKRPDTMVQRLGKVVIPLALVVLLSGCGALVTTPPAPIQATASTHVIHPYPTAQGIRTIYQATLTQVYAGWPHDPACAFTSQGLAVHPQQGLAYICLAPTKALTDFSLTATAQQTSGSSTHAYGLVFRHTSPHNYYFFGIDGTGHFTLAVVVNDISHVVLPFTSSSALHNGSHAVNQLQVIMKGKALTLLINGTAVGQATLSTFAQGTVGLRGINNGVVLFTHLTIAYV
ncbi:MAG TPA: hypothetical protein VHZ51_06750 [Ktedonobacteraceae bacterium]|jgi:hypothetical protein|nr:hypothetical protein [Ktedonobacteraceae bacterium]